jgi:hypothetical protein
MNPWKVAALVLLAFILLVALTSNVPAVGHALNGGPGCIATGVAANC